jgi:hypothetical protein
MLASRLTILAMTAVLAAAPAFAADPAAAPADAASAAKAAKASKTDCMDMSKMHDHGAEKGAPRAKSAGCKHDGPSAAKKDRHDHAKFNKNQ